MSLDAGVECFHRTHQILTAKHLAHKGAERVVVPETGSGVVVVDELAGQKPGCQGSYYTIEKWHNQRLRGLVSY